MGAAKMDWVHELQEAVRWGSPHGNKDGLPTGSGCLWWDELARINTLKLNGWQQATDAHLSCNHG